MESVRTEVAPWSSSITLVALTATLWSGLINTIVPEPYLDEVFHIGQAQAYLRGRWDVWDPKLTTPPGLYLASWTLLRPVLALDLQQVSADILTNAWNLRFTNLIGSVLLARLVRSLLLLNIEVHDGSREGKLEFNARPKRYPTWSGGELVHTTINAYLFPPLFFFYGLYYTDVLSALSVLYTYRCYLARQRTMVVFAGLLSLLFRQTNIFWVSVFLGGLALCRTIPKGRPGIDFPSQPTFYDIIKSSWQHASAYDPFINQACFEDYTKTGISYVVAGMTYFPVVLWLLSPYLVILCSFIQFVVWNGGVVLGDKENHVASIHLTQMIYIWPYFAFFSWPLLYPQCLPETVQPLSYPARFPRKAIICTIMVAMLVIVRYNTIVHPFTLADNRHYMFYVFRNLLRHPLIKYLAVPIYIGCAWVTLAALGGLPTARQATQQEPSRRPDHTAPPPKEQKQQGSGHRASFILIWLLATALSIITTPLVEPRYLIVPWLIWRLHIASPRPEIDYRAPMKSRDSMGLRLFGLLKAVLYEQHDHRLWLETIWFLTINLATGYIFLFWGFEWPQEPGKVQRFMW